MPAPLAAVGYRGIAQMLSSASRGSYRGPAVPVEVLARALSSTEGLDPGQLVEHTRAAVGQSSASGMRGGLVDSLFTALSQAAFGEILGRVVDTIGDWFTNREESEKIARDAEDAGKALGDIEDVADAGIEEILFALRAVITQLCAFLNQVDPVDHPREFAECVAAGADLIDSAGNTILECCRDRDTAVAGCLDEFLDRGTTVCEAPAVCGRTTVVCADGTTTAPPAQEKPTGVPTEPQSVEPATKPPAPETPAQTPPKTPTVPQSVEPPCEPAEPPTPPKKPVEEPTIPQSVEPVVDCPETSETPETPEEPEHVDQECSECCGVIGLVGVGVALIGIGLLVTALEDCEPLPVPEPPTPEPLPEPVPPTPEPVPEPPAPPKQNLTDVPEPPPPPKQSVPASVAAPPAAPAAPPAPAPVQGGARKAGEW